MDRNTLTAIVLCGLIYIGWYAYTSKHYTMTPQATPPATEQAATPAAPAAAPATLASGKTTEQKNVETIVLGDEKFKASFTTLGATVKEVKIERYKGNPTEDLPKLIGGSAQIELSSPSAEWAKLSTLNYSVSKKGKNSAGHDEITFQYEDVDVAVKRVYSLDPAVFSMDHDLTIQFKKQQPNYLLTSLQAALNLNIENEKREVFFNKQSGGSESWQVQDLEKMKEDVSEGRWVGFSSRYFLNAIVDKNAAIKPQFQGRPTASGEAAASLVYRVPGPSMQIAQRYYYGPKDVTILKAAAPGLDQAVDFGWFTFFAFPLLSLLKWLYAFVHNYGIAIILLTVIVKIVLYPLTLKSSKSMKEMQKIQPQMQKLRERYADDKERLNREMMTLMKTHGYNPLSGCLPIFVQMPIFIALYNVLYGAIDLYGQPFFGWIVDLSAKDPFFVTPVLLAGVMFVQQKLTPTTATDPAQQKMMMMMPLIFGFMMLWLPAGLTLYMLVNSVTSVIQQLMINKTLGIQTSKAV